MALLQAGLALSFYAGTRVMERLQRPQRLRQRLRTRGNRRIQERQNSIDAAVVLQRRRADLQASSWALALCIGSYALPILTPAALALTVYSMLPLLRASEYELLHKRRIGDDLVNFGVCIGSLGLSQPLGAAVQCLVFHAADVAVLRSRERARQLLNTGLPTPAPARVLRDGIETRLAVDGLQPGDLVLLATGEPVPVDARIQTGSISVDQQRLTGESLPRTLGPGDLVYAGGLVLRGEAQVQVMVAGRDTVLARVERLLRDSAGHNTQLQLKAEAIADAAALPLLCTSALVWPLIGPSAAVALLFSAPINAVRAAGAMAVSGQLAVLLEHGILIKDGRALEALADVDIVLFDKTGTLTADELTVAEITATGSWKPARVLAIAAAAEGRLTHPLAQALAAAAAREPDCPPLRATDLDFRVGFGVIATIDSQRVWVGGRRLLDAERISIDTLARSALDAAESRGETAILTANSSGVQGVISMTTRPRTEAAGIVHFLVDHGIAQVALISGDAEAPTHALAQALGIESAYDRVLPEDKAARVRELQQQGHRICFIGDGVNDALAMRQADCSVSLRGAAELATDTASILLLDGSLRGLPRLLTTARAQQTQLRRMLNYWGGYAVLNTGLALGLGVGVLPSSLLFGTVFGVGLLVAQPRSPQSSHRVSGPAAYAATDAGGENE